MSLFVVEEGYLKINRNKRLILNISKSCFINFTYIKNTVNGFGGSDTGDELQIIYLKKEKRKTLSIQIGLYSDLDKRLLYNSLLNYLENNSDIKNESK